MTRPMVLNANWFERSSQEDHIDRETWLFLFSLSSPVFHFSLHFLSFLSLHFRTFIMIILIRISTYKLIWFEIEMNVEEAFVWTTIKIEILVHIVDFDPLWIVIGSSIIVVVDRGGNFSLGSLLFLKFEFWSLFRISLARISRIQAL